MAASIRSISHVQTARRVVVTGLGLVTCLGVGTKHVWDRLIKGDCGITRLTSQDYDKIPCQVAGLVPRGDKPGELSLDKHVSPTDQRTMSLAAAYALVAAEEALEDSGWKPTSEEERHRAGTAIGMGMVGLQEISDTSQALRERGYKRVNPHFIHSILINMAAGHVSLKHGLKGPNHAVTTACTTGLHAIGDASRFIQFGDADVMVAGGAEASICPLGVAGFSRLRALSTKFNASPTLASRPFDKDRDGFVMAEGSGLMVLEELSHAQKRGAKIYGEILGYGLSADAYHITAPRDDGQGAYHSMVNALRYANITADSVGYINAHATSTPLGDQAESRAIHEVLKDNVENVFVSSTKGAVGHLLGAAGSVEAIFALLACYHGKVPPTVNLDQPDTGFHLNYVCKKAVDWTTNNHGNRVALTNSFGFGGTNGTLCIRNFVE